jgi:uncharacterized protein
MFRLDDDWVFSATDLVTALRCEYQVLRKRAEKAGLVEPLEVADDEIQVRAGRLGDAHEHNVLHQLVERYGEGTPGGVVCIDRPDTRSRSSLQAAHHETLAAFAAGAQVVFQASFFDGAFHGLADFVVRRESEGRVSYEPADTKFARHARVEALLQVAAYAHQLEGMGLPQPQQVHLWLGDGVETHHRYGDLRSILLDRRGRMVELLHRLLEPPVWDDPTVRQCGRCAFCKATVEQRRDLLLVAGMRADHRKRLVAAGIATVEDLAAASEAPPDLAPAVFERLHAQARLQSGQDASADLAHPDGVVAAELADPEGIAQLPPPSPGDVFFDFEGDPLFQTEGWTDLGLEYLFGVLTHGHGDRTQYRPIWAHDRRSERLALEEFIDWVTERRRQPGFEGLHVYHYAPYEVTALKRLVQRYGTRADELDALLRDNVFVDLYGTVRRSVRVSQRSYSIKKLEPLYMGDELRESEVTGGAESIVWYAEYQALRDGGDAAGAAVRLEALRSYNEYDCLSTLRLRDWLLALPGAPEPQGVAVVADDEPAKPNPARELAEDLRRPLLDLAPTERTPAQQATAMLAAALEYHRREVLPFWWDHFRRLGGAAEDWEHDGEMVVLDPADIVITADWHRPARAFERTFEVLVELPGSFKLLPGDRRLFAFHDPPLASHVTQPDGMVRGYAGSVTFDAQEPVGDRSRLTFTERLPVRTTELEPAHRALPVAVSADNSLEGRPMGTAIYALVADGIGPDGSLGPRPAFDLLQRLPPRLVGGAGLPRPEGGDGLGPAIVDAVRRLDRSYLAVQGPPGTGKSTTGAAVIAELVRSHGWKVGVVAQSHRTVEGLLDKVVDAGVPADRVLKKDSGGGEHKGTSVTDAELLACATAGADDGGCLIGGTAWDFVSDKRVPAGSLDLLVIDEAGQFSLADTIAVSRAAPRLLLLGDPQQLPQVSQAIHPEPVQRAALDWLADGHETLPAHLGYFLGTTYRMRPEVCAVVSHLSYDDRLTSDRCTAQRVLDGVPPGIVTHLVDHRANRAASNEEADHIVELVGDLLGRTWTDPFDRLGPGSRPLEGTDLVIVAPFNAQVNRLRERLDAAGHPDVPVGTVDKFQGREAAVAIVSMAASVANSSSRGAGFLLSRHRLNVAISRAQHTAYLVHAPQLTDFVPGSPDGLVRLGAFLGVSQSGRRG